jgi:hypothetical protein
MFKTLNLGFLLLLISWPALARETTLRKIGRIQEFIRTRHLEDHQAVKRWANTPDRGHPPEVAPVLIRSYGHLAKLFDRAAQETDPKYVNQGVRYRKLAAFYRRIWLGYKDRRFVQTSKWTPSHAVSFGFLSLPEKISVNYGDFSEELAGRFSGYSLGHHYVRPFARTFTALSTEAFLARGNYSSARIAYSQNGSTLFGASVAPMFGFFAWDYLRIGGGFQLLTRSFKYDKVAGEAAQLSHRVVLAPILQIDGMLVHYLDVFLRMGVYQAGTSYSLGLMYRF